MQIGRQKVCRLDKWVPSWCVITKQSVITCKKSSSRKHKNDTNVNRKEKGNGTDRKKKTNKEKEESKREEGDNEEDDFNLQQSLKEFYLVRILVIGQCSVLNTWGVGKNIYTPI